MKHFLSLTYFPRKFPDFCFNGMIRQYKLIRRYPGASRSNQNFA